MFKNAAEKKHFSNPLVLTGRNHEEVKGAIEEKIYIQELKEKESHVLLSLGRAQFSIAKKAQSSAVMCCLVSRAPAPSVTAMITFLVAQYLGGPPGYCCC